MRVTARTKPARCAYCHDALGGSLCSCGGAHADCVRKHGSCPACSRSAPRRKRSKPSSYPFGSGLVTLCGACMRTFTRFDPRDANCLGCRQRMVVDDSDRRTSPPVTWGDYLCATVGSAFILSVPVVLIILALYGF